MLNMQFIYVHLYKKVLYATLAAENSANLLDTTTPHLSAKDWTILAEENLSRLAVQNLAKLAVQNYATVPAENYATWF